MDAQWLKKGPELMDLAAAIDARGARKRIAIVIPSLRMETLRLHLDALARQTSRDFDVVIVYGAGSGPLAAPEGLRCVHIASRENAGSAGGFYAGEKYALEQGYEKVILADDDCIPLTSDLVEKLDRATDKAEIALPQLSYGGSDAPAPGNLLPQYGCVRSSALRGAGLTYAPLYFGGEDIELMERLTSRGAGISYVDAVASHPQILSSFLTQRQKIFYYVRGGIMGKYLNSSFARAFGSNLFFMMGSAYLLFIDARRAGAFFDAATMAGAMEFFRRDMYPDIPLVEDAPGASARVDIGNRIKWSPETRADISWYGRALARRAVAVLRAAPDALRAFGRDAVFDESIGVGAIPVLLAARRSYIRNRGKTYLVCDNRLYLLSPLAALALAALFPAVFAASFCLTCSGFLMKAIKGADSRAYGL